MTKDELALDPKEDHKTSENRVEEKNNEKEFVSPEVLYQRLIERVKKYHPSDDITMIAKAYETAALAHKDQLRKSGEPYIIHPLNVAIILADLELGNTGVRLDRFQKLCKILDADANYILFGKTQMPEETITALLRDRDEKTLRIVENTIRAMLEAMDGN